jgi:hypothetical protein
MDDGVLTQRNGAVQGALKVFRRPDGSWMVAYDEDGVTRIGKLTVVPNRTDLDRFETALHDARNTLRVATLAIAAEGLSVAAAHEEIETAFARYDFEIFYALEALRP